MPDAYSQLSEILDSHIDAKLSQFYKRVETLVKTHRIGSDQILPGAVTSPKLGNSIDAKIESIIAPLIADSQITTYYQAEPPIALAVGNLWIDTDSGNALKRWDGSSWVAVDNSQLQEALTAAGDAQATADGKIVTFAQESSPTATSIGDLWIDTNDNNKLYRWNGTLWATAQDGLLASHASAISSLTSSISAKTTIYYQISAPSSPATGDIWYDTDASPVVIYRWGGSSWANITTTALSSALAAASTAQSTADGKIRTFAQSTAPTSMATGDVGDLWVDTNDNNKLYRYSGSAWVAVQDTHNDALVATHSEAILSLNDVVDGKTTVFYQTSQPSSPATGDIWYDTDASPVVIYRWSGSSWVNITTAALSAALAAAGDAQATADGKVRSFAQTTAPGSMTAEDAGDLWVDTDDNNRLYRYNGSTWVSVQDGLIASHSTAISSLTTSVGGKTTIYYQTSQPTATATGDVWYDTDATPTVIYRWNGSAWTDITTTALSAALSAANTAQSTADGKIKTYAQTTAPTGMAATDVGDLWVDTDDNNKLYRYNGSTWVSVQDGLISSHTSAIAGLTTSLSGKTTIYYQTSQPTATATGDIWYDTDASPVTIKRWSGSAWVDITTTALSQALAAAADAQSTADGKIRTFAQDTAPTGMYESDVGDLWVDTNDNNKLYRWGGTGWFSVQDTHYDSVVSALTSSVNAKTTIFYQASTPTANVVGDMWYDTDAVPVVIYRWSGSAWVNITTVALSQALAAASNAQTTADGKINSYAQATAPTGLTSTDAGDLWIDIDDSNKLYRWSGSAWVPISRTSFVSNDFEVQSPSENNEDAPTPVLNSDVGHFSALTVDNRIDCDMVAWRYAGASSFTNVSSFTSILDALNYCYLDKNVTITLATGLGTITGAIEFIGIHGSGNITIYGNETTATAGVKFTDCSCHIAVNDLYSAYTETRSPYIEYVNCSVAGTYTSSGTTTKKASPTRTKLNGSSWITNTTDYVWQGYTSGNGRMYACFWFPNLSGYTSSVQSASIRLKRVAGIGQGSTVDVKVYVANNTTYTNDFTNPTSSVSLGSISNGETKTFALSSSIASALCAGKVLVLDPGNTAVMSGKTYSADYAKFYGYGTGDEPVLTITYATAGEGSKESTFVRYNENEPDWITIAPTNGTTPGTHGNGPLRFRKIGSKVYLSGGVNVEWTGNPLAICSLPVTLPYATGNKYWFKPVSGGYMARVFVSPAGIVYLEWVRQHPGASDYTTFSNWVDLNLEFWID